MTTLEYTNDPLVLSACVLAGGRLTLEQQIVLCTKLTHDQISDLREIEECFRTHVTIYKDLFLQYLFDKNINDVHDSVSAELNKSSDDFLRFLTNGVLNFVTFDVYVLQNELKKSVSEKVGRKFLKITR